MPLPDCKVGKIAAYRLGSRYGFIDTLVIHLMYLDRHWMWVSYPELEFQTSMYPTTSAPLKFTDMLLSPTKFQDDPYPAYL
jgi:hypothetical protein